MRLIGLIIALGLVTGLLYFAAQKMGPKPVARDGGGALEAGMKAVVTNRLRMAVLAAATNAQCGFSSEGGYAHYTPEAAAKNLVLLMNAASAPEPGAPKTLGTEVSYVEGAPTAPWQVSITVDADGKSLRIEGYATDLSRPMVAEKVPCG